MRSLRCSLAALLTAAVATLGAASAEAQQPRPGGTLTVITLSDISTMA